jgi:hypothetical protein
MTILAVSIRGNGHTADRIGAYQSSGKIEAMTACWPRRHLFQFLRIAITSFSMSQVSLVRFILLNTT